MCAMESYFFLLAAALTAAGVVNPYVSLKVYHQENSEITLESHQADPNKCSITKSRLWKEPDASSMAPSDMINETSKTLSGTFAKEKMQHHKKSKKFEFVPDCYADCSYRKISKLPLQNSQLGVKSELIYSLNLCGNSLKVLPANAFENFTSLKKLDLSNNPFTAIENNAFQGLKEVTALAVGGRVGQCGQSIKVENPAGLFAPLRKLLYLDISCTCFKLNILEQTLRNISTSLLSADFNKIFHVDVRKLQFAVLSPELTKPLRHTNLRKIFLEYNQIHDIIPGTFGHVHKLEVLSLRGNNILLFGSISPIDDILFNGQNLKSLDLGHQTYVVSTISARAYFNEDKLMQALTPRPPTVKSRLDRCPQGSLVFYTLSKLKYITVDRISLSIWETYVTYLDLDCVIFPNNSLTAIDMSYNKLYMINGTAKGVGTVRYLNFRGVQVKWFDDTVIQGFKAIEMVYLRSGLRTPGYKIPKIFLAHNPPPVRVIDISKNYLSNLPSGIAQNLTVLEFIDLSSNNFEEIKLNTKSLERLNYIDISSNKIKYISKVTRSILEIGSLKRNSRVAVQLNDNRLLCICSELQYFKALLHGNVDIIGNVIGDFNKHFISPVECSLSNGTTIALHSAIQFLIETCNGENKAYIFVTYTLYGSVVILMMLFAILYRYRWPLRYGLYVTRGLLSSERRKITNHHFLYDAFVSFQKSDAWWTYHELLVHLGCLEDQYEATNENRMTVGQREYHFCLHEKDFIPGMEIVSNIGLAIKHSKSVLLFVTKRFIKSRWCNMEASLAHSNRQHLETWRNIVAVVDPSVWRMPRGSLPSSLDVILSTVTCLEWPKDPIAQRLFWLRLAEALGPPLARDAGNRGLIHVAYNENLM